MGIVDRIRGGRDAERGHDRPSEALPAPFVVGMPRSGTTLLRLMLDAHPELAIPAETHFIPALIERWNEMKEAGTPDGERRARVLELITSHPRWPDLGIDAGALRAHLMAAPVLELGDAVRAVGVVHARSEGKARWGDKSPGYLVAMPAIQRVVPEAHFVHVIRDGRDIALSLAEVSWGPGDAETVARRWSRRIGVARRDAPGLAEDSYTEVRYEELATEPEQALRRVVEFLRLPWSEEMLAYHERAAERMAGTVREFQGEGGRTISAVDRERQHALVAHPPRADRIDRWRREMAPADLRRFERVAGPTLDALGYERGEPGKP